MRLLAVMLLAVLGAFALGNVTADVFDGRGSESPQDTTVAQAPAQPDSEATEAETEAASPEPGPSEPVPADEPDAAGPAPEGQESPAPDPEPSPEPETPQTVSNPQCPGDSLEGCFTYDQMDDYLNAVVPMVAQYFETAYPDVPAPRDIVYIPANRMARSYCGVSNSQAYEYCTGDQTIYVGQDLLWAFYREAGDAAPAVGLAHEWGHHLQYMMGVPFGRTQSAAVAFENQADCVSGAWAGYAEEQGWLETEDDIGDIETLMALIGSSEGRGRDHGTSQERAEAFDASYEGGMEACNAYFPDSPIV